MSPIQKFFTAIFPKSWAKAMEADSRAWMVRCSCGYGRSIWELGGIRWKASGKPSTYLQCPKCGQSSWHKVVKEP